MNKNFGSVVLTTAVLVFNSAVADAHGYITSPPGRAYLCQQKANFSCGGIQYEPQSLEGKQGFTSSGPRDGFIASADKSAFHEMDQQSPGRWAKTSVTAGVVNFVWKLTAQHKTRQWRYYITRPGWNASAPLTRRDFEPEPFCKVSDNGAIPGTAVTHRCILPSGHRGYQVVLGVWDIFDTGNAFYQAVDLNVQ